MSDLRQRDKSIFEPNLVAEQFKLLTQRNSFNKTSMSQIFRIFQIRYQGDVFCSMMPPYRIDFPNSNKKFSRIFVSLPPPQLTCLTSQGNRCVFFSLNGISRFANPMKFQTCFPYETKSVGKYYQNRQYVTIREKKET